MPQLKCADQTARMRFMVCAFVVACSKVRISRDEAQVYSEDYSYVPCSQILSLFPCFTQNLAFAPFSHRINVLFPLFPQTYWRASLLTLIAPITTAEDGKFCDRFLNFQKKSMIFHVNLLLIDNSHDISSLICYF